jgi:hypothetical protein
MKKLAAMVLTLLFASTASAQVISNPSTNARMDGMGVANWQVEDDFNIFINPGQIGNYKNNIYGELGNYTASQLPANAVTNPNQDGIASGSQWGGMNMDVSYGDWGVYLGRPYNSTGPLNLMGAGTAPGNNRFDLFYGLHGAMPLGFYLSYADQSENTKAGGTTFKDQSREINLGAGGIFAGGTVEGALDIALPTSKCSDTTGTSVACGNTFKSDAAPSLAILVRHHAGMGGNSKLLTTIQAQLIDASSKDSTSPVKFEDGTTAVQLDTALNSRPNPDTLVVAGIGIESSGREVKCKPGCGKVTLDNLTIPVNVAVEHQTFKAVKTRLGLSKPLYNNNSCKDTAGFGACSGSVPALAGVTKVSQVSDGAASVSAGLGWAVADNVVIDAVINQDVLFTGTYVVSGVSETLSSKLSATYRFK